MLLKDLYVVKAKDSSVNGTGDITSADVTISNYDGFLVLTDICSATAEVYQKDADGTSTKIATKTASHDTRFESLVFDIYRPRESLGTKAWVKIDREADKIAGAIYIIPYHGRVMPETSDQTTTTTQLVTTESKISPAEVT